MKKVVSCTLIMTLLILLLVPMSVMAFTVTQLPTPGRVDTFDISKTKNAINLYETGMIVATENGAAVPNEELTLTSKNEAVAKVKTDGTIVPTGIGFTVITAVHGQASASVGVVVYHDVANSADYESPGVHEWNEIFEDKVFDQQGVLKNLKAQYSYTNTFARSGIGSMYVGDVLSTDGQTHFFLDNVGTVFPNMGAHAAANGITEFWFYKDPAASPTSYRFDILGSDTASAFPMFVWLPVDANSYMKIRNERGLSNGKPERRTYPDSNLASQPVKAGWNQMLLDYDESSYNIYLNTRLVGTLTRGEINPEGRANGLQSIQFNRLYDATNTAETNRNLWIDDYAAYDMTKPDPKITIAEYDTAMGTVSAASSCAYDGNVEVSVTHNSGYEVESITVKSGAQDAVTYAKQDFVLQNVRADTVITVTFRQADPAFPSISGAAGAILVQDSYLYEGVPYRSAVIFSAMTVPDGWELTKDYGIVITSNVAETVGLKLVALGNSSNRFGIRVFGSALVPGTYTVKAYAVFQKTGTGELYTACEAGEGRQFTIDN